MNTTELVVEMRLEKNLDPYGIWIHDLCDTGAALYQLSYQANWGLMIILDLNNDQRWLQNMAQEVQSLMFLPNHDVFCDLLLNRPTATESICFIG